ncbi:unnamed protein product [Pelagomonas calceolata]|uniref:Uncharacterized protein n=1 Tax=Pelagomonas calceolata TaxID=35677 RepID=A0A8J2SS11_9STRA|nr:unnamed protein product [Pelagomonas calceolata]
MARRLIVALALSTASALVAPVQESFGFDFAEDQAENTADGILGERRLKEEFIRSYKPTATVLEGKPYPVFQEVQEKRILSATVNSGLLQSLDNLGLGLGDVEKLLPFLDKFGLIGLVRKNLPLAIIATGYLLIEPAPFLLPVLGLLLSIPTAAWTAVAAVTTGAEIYLNAFASFEDAGLVSLLLAPLLLIAGVLSLVPTAIGAIKSLPPSPAVGLRARHRSPVDDGVRLSPLR